MSNQLLKTTFTRALSLNPASSTAVIKSDSINIPYAGSDYNRSATPTSVATKKLIDTGANFLSTGANALGIKVGDTVWNTTNTAGGVYVAKVTSVDSATQLTLDYDIFPTVADTYKIFATTNMYFGSPIACYLHIGSTGIAKVMTDSGDIVTFYGLTANTILPVQIIRLYGSVTTITSVTALW